MNEDAAHARLCRRYHFACAEQARKLADEAERSGPVYYSAFGDGTPYATPEDADNAAAMLKAITQTSP